MGPAMLLTLSGLVTGQYPDQLDLFRAADVTPQILLLLDTSGSMGDIIQPYTYCPAWVTANLPAPCNTSPPPPPPPFPGSQCYALSKSQQVRAVLTGCQTPTDGLIHTWSSRVNFSLWEFGGSNLGPVIKNDAEFGSSEAALTAAANGLGYNGGTPMTEALGLAGAHFNDYFSDGNSKSCRPNYIMLMTDGLPNYNNFTAGYSCTDQEVLDAAAGRPWQISRYNFSAADVSVPNRLPRDMLCQVTGEQPIRNYSIGIQTDPTGDNVLTNVAAEGDGQYYHVDHFSDLQKAFTDIITRIVARSNVQYSSAGTQSDGIFSGNYIYKSSFKPLETGMFVSSVKKYCVFPYAASTSDYDPTNKQCLFLYDASKQQLFNNDRPVDIWTGTTAVSAVAGGSGQMVRAQMLTPNGPSDAVPAAPYSRRNILTWRPGTQGYVNADPNTLTPSDTWTAPLNHGKVLNYLWGYTFDTTLVNGQYAPTAVGVWPLGDVIDSPTVLLKYSATCEQPGDKCYVVVTSNDGMLHFFDAQSGSEASAMIPAELWRPSNVAVNNLKDIFDQPDFSPAGGACAACDLDGDGQCTNVSNECCAGAAGCTSPPAVLNACAACDTNNDGQCTTASGECGSNGQIAHRFYFDGGLRLFHDDTNGNQIIDPGETAFLVAALGRGGRAYYRIPVNPFNGVLDSTSNPPYPLELDGKSAFQNLRETWAAPVFTTADLHGHRQKVAIIPSGHIRSFDAPQFPFAQLAADLQGGIDLSHPNTQTCDQMMALIGAAPAVCSQFYHPGCTPGAGPPSGCYDSLLTGPQPPSPPLPQSVTIGPFSYINGAQLGVAFRVHFPQFDLQPGDYVQLLDSSGTVIQEYELNGKNRNSGPDLDATGAAAWVYGTQFSLRVLTNGIDDVAAAGVLVGSVDIVLQDVTPSGASQPTVYVMGVDSGCQGCIDAWNGQDPVAGRFAGAPTDDRQNTGILLRITQSCGQLGPNEICVDAAGSSGTPSPDLQGMVCPISGEPAIYAPGEILESIYWGDECGQIWKAHKTPTGWGAQLLLRTNAAGSDHTTIAGQFSKDYRKIFTKLDLVLSTCNGSRSIGVYFGTGNLQRAGASDNLQNPALLSGTPANPPNSGRNVFGVVWDSPSYCQSAIGAGCIHGTATLDDLFDASNVAQIDQSQLATGKAVNGWYLELFENEGMYRNPVVLNGVAYFKTYQVQTAATECVSAVGLDRVYALNSCTTQAAVPNPATAGQPPSTADRQAWQGQSDIGGGLLLLTPKNGDIIVSAGSGVKSDPAKVIPGPQRPRAMRVFSWWRRA